MRRWGLWIALMLSLGVNIGVLLMVVADRAAPGRLAEPPDVEPPLVDEDPGPGGALLPEVPVPPQEAAPEPPPEAPSARPPQAEPAPTPRPEPAPPRPEPLPSRRPEPSPSPPPPEAPTSAPEPRPEGPAAASPAPDPGADALRRAQPKLELLADRLRLRGRQRERFLEAQVRFFTEVTARRVELATLRRELRRELTSPRPDRRRIRRLLERSGRATAELDAAFAENVLTVRRILGPRQQQAYFRFLERLRSGMEGRDRPEQR